MGDTLRSPKLPSLPAQPCNPEEDPEFETLYDEPSPPPPGPEIGVEEFKKQLEEKIMNFLEIAKRADGKGCDLITVKPQGSKTLVICERRMSSNQADLVFELDESFWDLEHRALEELTQAGLDARPSSLGIRAFGRQDDNVIDQAVRRAHAPKHVPDTTYVAHEFQPQGVHRKDFNTFPEREPRDIWGEGATW